MTDQPNWLTLGRELLALAQTGLAFTRDPFDVKRYERLQEIASILLSPALSMDAAALIELVKREKGYATPKVSTRGAVFRDDCILMVREVSDGKWTLPGGWADVNQTAAECTEREIYEESGFTARCVKLAAVFDSRVNGERATLFHEYKIFFLCELTGGAPRTSIETDAIDFFAESDLPELSVNRSTEAQIHRMFAHLRNPALPTDFDC